MASSLEFNDKHVPDPKRLEDFQGLDFTILQNDLETMIIACLEDHNFIFNTLPVQCLEFFTKRIVMEEDIQNELKHVIQSKEFLKQIAIIVNDDLSLVVAKSVFGQIISKQLIRFLKETLYPHAKVRKDITTIAGSIKNDLQTRFDTLMARMEEENRIRDSYLNLIEKAHKENNPTEVQRLIAEMEAKIDMIDNDSESH